MKLSIIVVSWNTRQLLADCLESVYAYPPQSAFEVVLVDNASADGSADMVREQFPQVRLVESSENVGFAQGNNLAVPLCQGEYVLLLNPDTVVKPNAFDALIEFLDENPEAGSAGSMLLNPDETLQPSCQPAPRLTRELWRLFHLDVVKPYG
ncbi:MAG: glycosyltransferase family 2 protein, partial [Chloroflexi bacterium]|nr:glycosyltransferase family 2 protein [Chloroflexota bacterium]